MLKVYPDIENNFTSGKLDTLKTGNIAQIRDVDVQVFTWIIIYQWIHEDLTSAKSTIIEPPRIQIIIIMVPKFSSIKVNYALLKLNNIFVSFIDWWRKLKACQIRLSIYLIGTIFVNLPLKAAPACVMILKWMFRILTLCHF